jgi:Tol biopolymer transport system component
MAALAGCDAERILAIAVGLDGGGNPGDAGPNDAGDATVSPGDAGDATVSPSDGGSFGTPQVVAGLRGDAFDVQDPSMTDEARELYFASASGGQSDIWVARRTFPTDPWGSGALLPELSSPQNDEDPEVSADGLNLFLSSDRGGDGKHVYVARRRTRDTPWEQPVRVDGLGSATLDVAPAVNRAQLYLVFASQRNAAPDLHLYAATRPDASAAWQLAGELTALNSTARDTDPALFEEGRSLIFASRRTAPGGKTDLFHTARPDVSAPFASRVDPLGDLNTVASEEDPWVSQDGRHILFVSDRDGRNRIYEARR